MRNHWTEIEKYLEDQKIAQELIGELRDFHMRYEVEDQVKERVEKPDILFYGKKILEMSIAALLQGDNLLLSGAKATGKNVLCETLAWIFGRPEYDISFHVNTDSADLIGTDTFINNEVRLRKGPIYQCAEFGGFGILDEINMAKNDANIHHDCYNSDSTDEVLPVGIYPEINVSYEKVNPNASPAVFFDNYGHSVVPLLGGLAIRDINAEETQTIGYFSPKQHDGGIF